MSRRDHRKSSPRRFGDGDRYVPPPARRQGGRSPSGHRQKGGSSRSPTRYRGSSPSRSSGGGNYLDRREKQYRSKQWDNSDSHSSRHDYGRPRDRSRRYSPPRDYLSVEDDKYDHRYDNRERNRDHDRPHERRGGHRRGRSRDYDDDPSWGQSSRHRSPSPPPRHRSEYFLDDSDRVRGGERDRPSEAPSSLATAASTQTTLAGSSTNVAPSEPLGAASVVAESTQGSTQLAPPKPAAPSTLTQEQLFSNPNLVHSTRNFRRLYVGNLPMLDQPLTEKIIADYFTVYMKHLGFTTPRPILDVHIKCKSKSYCFIEFRSVADCDAVLALMQGAVMGSNHLKINRPQDYTHLPPELYPYIVGYPPGSYSPPEYSSPERHAALHGGTTASTTSTGGSTSTPGAAGAGGDAAGTSIGSVGATQDEDELSTQVTPTLIAELLPKLRSCLGLQQQQDGDDANTPPLSRVLRLSNLITDQNDLIEDSVWLDICDDVREQCILFLRDMYPDQVFPLPEYDSYTYRLPYESYIPLNLHITRHLPVADQDVAAPPSADEQSSSIPPGQNNDPQSAVAAASTPDGATADTTLAMNDSDEHPAAGETETTEDSTAPAASSSPKMNPAFLECLELHQQHDATSYAQQENAFIDRIIIPRLTAPLGISQEIDAKTGVYHKTGDVGCFHLASDANDVQLASASGIGLSGNQNEYVGHVFVICKDEETAFILQTLFNEKPYHKMIIHAELVDNSTIDKLLPQ